MQSDEHTPLLPHTQADDLVAAVDGGGQPADEEAKDALALMALGDRLPYENYTTIDWLHDLTSSHTLTHLLRPHPLRLTLHALTPWLTVLLAGLLTASIAFLVDVTESSVSDWKEGYCAGAWWRDKRSCAEGGGEWGEWSEGWGARYAVYTAAAVVYGIVAAALTLTTKKRLPEAEEAHSAPKYMYMAAGSGIPELKTFISGFVIPHFLTVRVLVTKSLGAVFAVATGMCLAKEGPFVHMSACVADLCASLSPRYRTNEAERRGIVSAGCAAGLSVAFGAPIGGVLFSFEEVSTYFPRRILHLAFLCSLTAAVTLVSLNPTGTGRLVLFPTRFESSTTVSPERHPQSLAMALLLGVAGGLFGAVFCKANFAWARWFRSFRLIRQYPVLEAALVTLLTALVQYPNPLVRTAGDETLRALLVDCSLPPSPSEPTPLICTPAAQPRLLAWLIHGSIAKLCLTTITFGVKVPSGIIIPSLDAGALFGRLVGQFVLPETATGVPPGALATVAAAAFLAGVTRMTVSLAVIMLELTGELAAVVPHMIAILAAKWVADALEPRGVYDLAQILAAHPFLDREAEEEGELASGHRVAEVVPDEQTMRGITVRVDGRGCVGLGELRERVAGLRRRGLLDAGLAVLGEGEVLLGYVAQGDIAQVLAALPPSTPDSTSVQLAPPPRPSSANDLPPALDISPFLDRTPLTLDPETPLDVMTELFAKLGLRYVLVVDRRGTLRGVVLKKRLVGFLEGLKERKGG